MRVIVNTSPLIALERIGKLDLLKRMYGTIVRPQSVLDELIAGRTKFDLASIPTAPGGANDWPSAGVVGR